MGSMSRIPPLHESADAAWSAPERRVRGRIAEDEKGEHNRGVLPFGGLAATAFAAAAVQEIGAYFSSTTTSSSTTRVVAAGAWTMVGMRTESTIL